MFVPSSFHSSAAFLAFPLFLLAGHLLALSRFSEHWAEITFCQQLSLGLMMIAKSPSIRKKPGKPKAIGNNTSDLSTRRNANFNLVALTSLTGVRLAVEAAHLGDLLRL
jgi:hypothetical protein